MKKILYLLDKPNLYGSEIHVLNLIHMLKDDYKITLACFDDGPLLKRLPSSITVKVFPSGWAPGRGQKALLQYLKDMKFDYIHCHQPKAMLWGTILAKMSHTKAVITVHSLPANNRDTYKNYVVRSFVFLFHSAIKILSELLADKIIYLTKFVAVTSLFKAKSVQIPNWLPSLENVDCSGLNQTLKLISVGSLCYQKGYDRLVQTLSQYKHYDWRLQIIGDGKQEYVDELRDMIKQFGLSDRIELLGYKGAIDSYLRESDYFILFSRGETFGMVYIEAMNNGLPIIAWDIPAVQEIVPDHNLIIDSSIQLENLFNRSFQEKYQQIKVQNYQHIRRHFSVDKVKQSYLYLYV